MTDLIGIMQAVAGNAGGDGADANFSDTTLLLQGDTSNEAMLYNAFGDASTNAHDITPVGGVHGTPLSPYNNSWSVEFDGVSDSLSLPNSDTLSMGTGDFTIEFWVYSLKSSRDTFFLRMLRLAPDGSSSIQLGHILTGAESTGAISYYAVGSTQITGTTDIRNAWHHVALVRNSGTVSLYVDGVSEGTPITDTANKTYNAPRIGSYDGSQGDFEGFISNLRIVKGTAVYTSSFTPSTTPLTDVSGTSLLTCNANRFIDTSSNDHTITVNGNPEIKGFSPFADTDTVTGSGYFDGSGDYLEVVDNSDLKVGSSEFTFECWVWPKSTGSIIPIYTTRGNTLYAGMIFDIKDNGTLRVLISTDGSNWTTNVNSTAAIDRNAWNHVALVRSSGVLKVYLDGVEVISTAFSANLTTETSLSLIGGNLRANEYFDGYIANFRAVVGSAVYTSAFTPPTSPLTEVTNTKLLTLQNRGANRNIGFIDSSHPSREITRNGNVTQGSFSPFSQDEGKWGNYFDGTGDYLDGPSTNTVTNFGTGDFTAEFWFYTNTTASQQNLLDNIGNSSYAIYIPAGGASIRYYVGGDVITGGAISSNTWHHVALVRSSSSTKLYLNGTQTGSTYSDSNNYAGANNFPRIGGAFNGTVPINGYMSNVRIVKGTAVYTSTFTPSTTPLTAITNTSLLTCQSNRFVDNSSNAHSITVNGDPEVTPFSPFAPSTAYDPATKGGSGYADGSSGTNHLSISDTDIIDFGTGDFTTEWWVYQSSAQASCDWLGGSGASGHYGTALVGGTVYYGAQGVNNLLTKSYAGYYNQWTHIAISRNSGTSKMFFNGVQVATSADTNNYGASACYILDFPTRDRTLDTFITDVRIIKGTGLYTSAFTPPTAPLADVSDTVFLCNFTNAGIYDGTGRNVLETVGDSHVENSVKKYGTGSMEFDGTGDYLEVPSSDLFDDISGGAFTIEGWVRFNANGNQGVFHLTDEYFPAATEGYTVHQSGTNKFSMYHSGTVSISTKSIVTDVWYHFALVRNSSGTLKLFVDGTEELSVSDTTSTATTHLVIGGYYSTSFLMDGYIDDFRITKDVARYTANFTAPEAKLPNL